MSLDAGGLAQMTYNNFPSKGGLAVPGAGFASRGKGAQLKRLSVAPPPKIGTISENHVDNPTPRTSRSHLLAGLRTAPKTPTHVPASAPYSQSQHRFGLDQSRHASSVGLGQNYPQSASTSGFPAPGQGQYGLGAAQQLYSLSEQVLAPPPLQFDAQDSDGMDPQVVAQLMATEFYLQQRQQQLQQQLLNLTAQQFGAVNLNGSLAVHQPQFPATPMTPSLAVYNQMQSGLNIQEVPGQPGLFLVYNPLTGQSTYVVDQSVQQQAQQVQEAQQASLANSPPPPTPSYTSSPPKAGTPTAPTFRAEVSPPNDHRPSPFAARSSSPPKKSPSPPVDVAPLPPPSANAFRRHKKTSSLALNGGDASDAPKSAFARIPQTPMTGTFGPGQNRAGEHPVRQPRGPPPFEELKACPTTKHEGGKNFATRQRRRAVHSLVRAGIERRGVRSGSGGSMTPTSDPEMGFSLPSDNDSESGRSHASGSLSGKPSIGSLRAAASGAIGSERKEMKERSRDRRSVGGLSAKSISSDEGIVGGKLVDVRVDEQPEERRRTPMLVLTSAEKRKTIF